MNTKIKSTMETNNEWIVESNLGSADWQPAGWLDQSGNTKVFSTKAAAMAAIKRLVAEAKESFFGDDITMDNYQVVKISN